VSACIEVARCDALIGLDLEVLIWRISVSHGRLTLSALWRATCR